MLQDGGLSHSQDLWLVDLQFWEPSLLSVAISSPTCLPTMCLNVQRRCDTLHAQDMGKYHTLCAEYTIWDVFSSYLELWWYLHVWELHFRVFGQCYSQCCPCLCKPVSDTIVTLHYCLGIAGDVIGKEAATVWTRGLPTGPHGMQSILTIYVIDGPSMSPE